MKSTRNKIKQELDKESSRFICPNYSGVIFVHPDDVVFTVDLLSYYGEINVQRKQINLPRGGVLKVSTVEGAHPHHNYAGYELTSVLISQRCFGYFEGKLCEWVPVGTALPSDVIMYMSTRLRSTSAFHEHMVLF